MKIRQIMIASLLLFSGTKALAQPERVSVWDGFGDNVYMDAGVGVQALFAPGWQDIAFGKQITPALNLGVGKWITPFGGCISMCSVIARTAIVERRWTREWNLSLP